MVSISSPKFSTPDIWLSARRKSPSPENILLTSRSNDERTDKRPGHKTSRPASQERPVLGHRGIAVLMILIMWLTGGKKTAPAKINAPTVAPPAPVEVNETKIADLQQQLEELQ